MISEFPMLRIGLFLGVLVFMFSLETLWPARTWFDKRSERIRFSIGLALVNNLFIRVFIAAPFVAFSNWVHDQGWGLLSLWSFPTELEFVLTLLVFDFLDALKHRWFHRVPFMWRFHRVHHTDRSLDILTALRYHPGELAISAVIKGIWILAWGPSALAFTLFEVTLNLASEFHHSNITLGKWDSYLNKVLVTPRYHAIHHTIHREKGDQNFSTIFSFWDRLMGTHSAPETTRIDLERLYRLQGNHLSLKSVLKSPMISPHYNGEEELDSFEESNSEALFSRVKKEFESDKFLVVDVREEEERQKEGYFKSILSVPFKSIDRDKILRLKSVASTREVLVFCKAGVRSQKVADQLKELGLPVTNLGGYQDCVQHGMRTVFEETFRNEKSNSILN